MKVFGIVGLAMAGSMMLAHPVQAQTTIDVSKITCEQWLSFKVADPNFIALWLSGYYNGKRDNTIVEVQAFKDDIEKLKTFCITNPKTFVMKAVETKIIKKKD
jgi:acid stress chaperone HdeB